MLGEAPYQVENLSVHGPNTREELRRRTVLAFLKEKGSLRKGEFTRYHYIVERLRDRRRIYLRRPTRERGFDFEVWIEGRPNSEDKCYGEKKMMNDLRNKIFEDPKKSLDLYEAIVRVYDCEEPDVVLYDYPDLSFQTGEKAEVVLKTLKWLFIEQDLRCWNHSGRNILKLRLDSLKRKPR